MKNILIVEDEAPIRTMVSYALSQAGYHLTEAGDAYEANEYISDQEPDLILMDWMLPGQNGVEITKRLKQNIKTRHIPIIMLTALNSEQDKVTGLSVGADDYISKPFSPRELVARINAVIRRANPDSCTDSVLSCHQLTLDPVSHRVCVGDQLLSPGPTEYRLLKFLMLHPDRVYSREQLLDNVWGQNVYVEERTVDVHILRLRQSLMPYGYDRHVQTVRGAGYRFTVSVE
uniref:Phosphate regulon transcriptional regulatory protein PhoB n=1 Tax=uncultured Thiotrichaceae bacterium TaxID=298394 RepID=A0A6S6U7N1_9GAMM|nr:MAG: Phosphate regulon transcriptional regulatory protein PhoB (SphR) [uncultured Thiotrichaceae bacterium]